jgi:hypothetical protein
MHVSQSYHKLETPQYVEALLRCQDKKVCTNLAKTLNVSHDNLYHNFRTSISSGEHLSRSLETIAHNELNEDNTYLIHDDTHLIKIYAKQIEGIEVGYDGSTSRPCLGIKMMTSLLTDTKINIPIDATPYVSEELAQSSYKTKSRLAIETTRHVIKRFKIKRMLGDAHFATNEMLFFLNEEAINFLMKITRTRKVTIDGLTGQLQNILRLKKNSHTKVAKGTINGIQCYFYVIKIRDESTIYLISNDYIEPSKVIELYRIRWNIEIFHRTAKQYLGLSDCQMRAIEKQRQHALHVMHAYAQASVQTALMGLKCVEDFIKHHRDVKPRRGRVSDVATGQSLCKVA